MNFPESDNNQVTDRASFSNFVNSLLDDYTTNPENWTNVTLHNVLEALARYTEDIQGYYDNTNQNVNANIPSWRVFADILKGASIYE